MNQIYIFDICGTLYHSNTTFDFLEYFLKDTSIYYRYYNILRKTIVWRLFNKVFVAYGYNKNHSFALSQGLFL